MSAAVAIADGRGLSEVSIRSVAGALKAGPMRLYGFLSSKEELLELMVDEVFGELVATGPIKGGWRQVLRTVADRLRHAAAGHAWFVELVAGRPHLGPNALAFSEASLAALSRARGFERIDSALAALATVNAYTIGATQNEVSELRAEAQSGLNQAEWQDATWPYLQRMITTGRYPTLARLIRDASHPSPTEAFEAGLAIVLDGVAVRRGAE